jgi:nucleoside-diphosphate-sugar epimerase
MTSINVEGTRNILKVIDEINGQHGGHMTLIFASSQEAIGPTTTDSTPADESTPLSPTYFYGQTKVQAEHIITQEYSHIPSVILRITGVTGNHDKYAAFEFIQAISLGIMVAYPGQCNGKTSFVHVTNVIQAIKLVIKKSLTKGTYIIGPANSLTYKESIDVICDKLKWHRPWFHCPMWLFRSSVALVSPIINLFRHTSGNKSSFLFNVHTLDCMNENREYSSALACNELNYSPMTMQDAFRTSIQEHVDHGDISTANQHKKRFALVGLLMVSVGVLFIVMNSTTH